MGIALVLQGGGAMGAYQAGVFQALDEHGLRPDWLVGTSIGAINAAIIAGNAPEDRLARLSEFWQLLTRPNPGDVAGLMDAVPEVSSTASIVRALFG